MPTSGMAEVTWLRVINDSMSWAGHRPAARGVDARKVDQSESSYQPVDMASDRRYIDRRLSDKQHVQASADTACDRIRSHHHEKVERLNEQAADPVPGLESDRAD